MVMFGVGELTGGFFIGFIVDKYGSKMAAVANVLIIIVMITSTIAYCLIN